MAPELFDVVVACPTTRTWKTRPAGPDLAGVRDRALLLVGFYAALRRRELTALTLAQISTHDRGPVLALPHSKTNQTGTQAELVVLPAPAIPSTAPSPRYGPGSTTPPSPTARYCARAAPATAS
jgi:hypothetical protein